MPDTRAEPASLPTTALVIRWPRSRSTTDSPTDRFLRSRRFTPTAAAPAKTTAPTPSTARSPASTPLNTGSPAS